MHRPGREASNSQRETNFPSPEAEGGGQGEGGRGRRAEGGGQREEGRGRRTEGGGQRAEGRGRRAEGRGHRAEGRGRRAEGGGQREEGRGRRAEGGEGRSCPRRDGLRRWPSPVNSVQSLRQMNQCEIELFERRARTDETPGLHLVFGSSQARCQEHGDLSMSVLNSTEAEMKIG
ncbi:hypothetical protein RRG08_050303 [Elysia crispata]|uniref:Uncharacterized protein n=1 Tax=Elysia crispata TaxID=231223 RepID=A0AAE1DPX7_9GAST|nr:hypothetical protein RRG08_050303 [Elysia crispata]